MDPLLSFAAAMALLVSLMALGRDVVEAVAASTAAFGVLSLGWGVFPSAARGLASTGTVNLLSAVALALSLAHVMRWAGILDGATAAFVSVGKRFAAVSVPALVGLIPMPGGALVSAMMMRGVYLDDMGVNRPLATFLNYWFRHVWVAVWPLYQGILITAAILDSPVRSVISATFPASLASVAAGLLVAVPAMGRPSGGGYPTPAGSPSPASAARGLWPFALVVASFLAGLPVTGALALTLAAVLVATRPDRSELREAVAFALNPRFVVLILSAMVLRQFVLESGASGEFLSLLGDVGVPPLAAAFLIPMAVGVFTAAEFVYAASVFPLMKGLLAPGGIIDPSAMLTAYAGGFVGVMLSPAHLCLVLTAEHFGSRVPPVYRYLLPAAAVAAALSGAAALAL